MADVPGLADYPALPTRGPLAIRGQVRMRSGENEATVVGITIGPGTFGDAPGNTFLGNATNDLDPVRPWDWDTFAGAGITYTVSALGANFADLVGRDGQAWSVAATTQTWLYPPNLELEALLVVVVNTGGLTTLSTPTGWTLEGSQTTSESRLSVYSRVIDGTEDPTETFTLGTASGGLVQTWVFDRAHGDVEVVAAVNDNPAGTSLDIGSISPTWAGGGATNTYYIAVLGLDTESGTTVTVFPTSYTPTGQDAIASATASINNRIAYADRKLLSTAEDPSTFTYGAARAAAFIIAVRGKDAGQIIATPGGSSGWDDVLLNDPHSGASNPIVDDAQYLQFGIAAPPATGQIRTNEPWEARGSGRMKIRAGEEIDLQAVDSSSWIVSAGGLDITTLDGIDITSTASSVQVLAATNIGLTATAGDIVQAAGGFISIIPQGGLFLGDGVGTDTIAVNAAGVIDINSTTDLINLQAVAGINLTVTAGDINLTSSADTHIHPSGDLHLGHVAFTDTIHQEAGTAIEIESSGLVDINAGTTLHAAATTEIHLTAPTIRLPTGFLEFTEKAASTPSMLAGQALFWVKSDTPNNPFFTDDTNADRQIATFPIPLGGFATIADGTFLGNVSGGTAVPSAINLSTLAGAGLVFGTNTLNVTAGAGASLVVGANDIQRGALTGAITAPQDSNTTSFGALAAKSVLANATNASAVPAALAGSVADTYLRVNAANNALEFGALPASTAGWDDVLAIDATSGANDPIVSVGRFMQFGLAGPSVSSPQIRSGDAVFRLRGSGTISFGGVTGASLFATGAAAPVQVASDAGGLFLDGFSEVRITTNATARLAISGNGEWTSPSGGSAGTPFLHWTSGGPPTWASVALSELTAIAANTYVANATAGAAAPTAVAVSAESIPARTSGNLTQLTSAAQSILLRAAGSLFFATAAADQVLRRSGSGDLGFGTLVTNNIGTNQVTNARLAQMVARSVKVNATNATADPTDLQSSAALQYLRSNSGNTGLELSNLSVHASTSITYTSDQFQRAAFTGDVTAAANNNALTIAANAVTNAKAAQMAANTIKGNNTASTANAVDISVGTNTVLGRVGGNIVASALVGGQVAANTLNPDRLVQFSAHRVMGNATEATADLTSLDQPALARIMNTGNLTGAHTIMWVDEDFDKGIRGPGISVNVGSGSHVDVFNGVTGWNGNWFCTGIGATATLLQQTSDPVGHRGVLILTTGAASTNGIALYLARDFIGGGNAEATFDADDFESADFYIMLPTVTNVALYVGIGSDISAVALGNDSIVYELNAPTDNSLAAITRASSSQTGNDTGFVPVAGQWMKLSFYRNSSANIEFYINNLFEVTHSTNITTANLTVGLRLVTNTAATRSVHVDRIRVFLDDAALIG